MATRDGVIFHRMVGEHFSEGMPCPAVFPDESMQKIKSFTFRDEDVLVATYPKAGTTWMQEIVWLIRNNFDTEAARAKDIDHRFPFMELAIPGDEANVDHAAALEGPRSLKSHLRPYFFEQGLRNTDMKVIVVMRNLKDNLVSLYHFYKHIPVLGNFKGTFSEFFELFKLKHLHFGDWFDFNLDWWELRDNPNIMFTTYEEMKGDIRYVIKKVALFLGTDITEEQVDIVQRHAAFDNMKDNSAVNRIKKLEENFFMRKGIVGDWENHFNHEEIQYTNTLIKDKLKGTGLMYDAEISG